MNVANRMKLDDPAITGLEYDCYDPLFVRVDDAAEIGLTEEELDELCDGGQHVLPASLADHKWEATAIRPCMMMVRAGDLVLDDHLRPTKKIRENSGRIYWFGWDKHGGADCRVETDGIVPADFQELAGVLGFGLCKICGKKLAKGHVGCTGCQEE